MNKRGRPTKPADVRRTKHRTLRLSPEELAKLEKVARKLGTGWSTFARDAALNEADEILSAIGQS